MVKLFNHQSEALSITADKSDGRFKNGKDHINYKHGLCKTRIYRIWETMKHRCYCKGQTSYKYDGARGITVCDEWRNDFKAFYDWSMSNGYSDELTLERIDVNGNYSTDNCRWVSMKEQTRNKSSNRMMTYNGKTQCLSDWASELKIDRRTISKRIDKLGWTVEKALSTPLTKKGGGLSGETLRTSEKSSKRNSWF